MEYSLAYRASTLPGDRPTRCSRSHIIMVALKRSRIMPAGSVLLWTVWRRRDAFMTYFKARRAIGILGGIYALGSCGLELWAMTRAPTATTAALRETSTLYCSFSWHVDPAPLNHPS
jgi:hypothetical protein